MVINLKSYVKDTGDVLGRISKISLEEEILLVEIDVESLYTLIPHEWGIKAVEVFLESLGEHMGEILDKNTDQPMARHFAQFHKGNLSGMMVKGIYSLNLSPRRGDFDRVLQQNEKWWIFRLVSLIPLGLNTELNLQPFLET